MIRSLLDNDLYKLTMQQGVHMLYPRADVRYHFINRGENVFPAGFSVRLTEAIERMAVLSLNDEEATWLEKTCGFLTPVYLDFLRHYRYDPSEVRVSEKNAALDIEIEGPWYRAILWEVPLMAIVSELYFEMTGAVPVAREERKKRNIEKAETLRAGCVKFADFGTR